MGGKRRDLSSHKSEDSLLRPLLRPLEGCKLGEDLSSVANLEEGEHV